jgi:hypothetical protein
MLRSKHLRTETLRLALLLSLCCAGILTAEYRQGGHYQLPDGAVAVDGPGCYDQPGVTYMLTGNVSSRASGIFLGKDVTLDLNGYTLSFADGGYGHVPNYGFEEGLAGWDVSRAPGAQIESTRLVHVFIGEKILRLSAGDEIVSGWVDLPVAERSYFAICGVLTWKMEVSVFVEDEQGRSVQVVTDYGDTTLVSCPVQSRKPRLGGGFVTAHLQGLPAGKYRVRVRADTDCLVDHIDIRPALDAGVGVVGSILPRVHYDYLYQGEHVAFRDYGSSDSPTRPADGIPVALGVGTVTIRNGTIRSGVRGICSMGVQSTADSVQVILDNVRVINSGINANAVDIPTGTLTNCRFDIDNPFIINRHVSEHAVVLRSQMPSEVSYSEFFGGQGNLTFFGPNSSIHHNLFVNRQTITNHYCVMARGDGSRVFANRFEPEIGSGLEIFRHKNIDVFDNDFHIEAAPPSCEYGHEEYSTTAIRIADYNARPGDPRGCWGNRIYNNRMYITGRDYPEYPDYIPMAWAIFYSCSGGDNFIFGNEIVVNHRAPGSKAEASAFYIGGGSIGGKFEGNRVTSNVPAAWIGNPYGGAKGAVLAGNEFIRADNASADYEPFRLGFVPYKKAFATDIEFRSNRFIGSGFSASVTGQPHNYKVFSTLNVNVVGDDGTPLASREVSVANIDGEEVFSGVTCSEGMISVELLSFSFDNGKRGAVSRYTVRAGGRKEKVNLESNNTLKLVLSK